MDYQLIEDLDDELRAKSSELLSLAAAWSERQDELAEHAALEEMRQRMRRRWSIETGMIEGLYALDRGTTQLLIDRGLHADLLSHETDASRSAVIAYLHDQASVYDWLYEFIKSERPLSSSFIKELHQLLTRSQADTEAIDGLGRLVRVNLIKGDWKRLPNNPTREDGTTHAYAPPELVPAEMDRLIEMHRAHSDVAPEVEAAWLHHRFTQIHPFQDGNGRVARALASLILLRAHLFPLSVSPDDKGIYIDHLESADAGDLSGLVEFIASAERRELRQALSIADDLSTEQKIFESAFSKARAARQGRAAKFEEVFTTGHELLMVARSELELARNQFNDSMRREKLDDEFQARVYHPRDGKQNWYFASIVSCSDKLGYFADTRTFHDWVNLRIQHEIESRKTDLIVSIHSVGRTFKGILAVSAFIEVVQDGPDGREVRGPALAADDAFTFGYLDSRESLEPQFRRWLESARLSLLRVWNDSL